DLLHHVGHAGLALDVVVRDRAEQVLPTLLCDLGVRGEGDLRQVGLALDRSARHGRARAEVGEDQHVLAVVRHLLGRRAGLLRVTLVNFLLDHDLLAEQPALGVPLVDGHVDAVQVALSELGHVAGQRTGPGELDLAAEGGTRGRGGARGCRRAGGRGGAGGGSGGGGRGRGRARGRGGGRGTGGSLGRRGGRGRGRARGRGGGRRGRGGGRGGPAGG